ncbi:hypothetical protein ONZ51_g1599 [Trametes cubensis]|uniref:BRCT domain-containing protein n=1 Tax=Trametes cubensis TaxID=1111947 RepID=A0AAD7U3S4_9APHY|nr:hypothetical protein ONZ51_g1599 [Trametes cubensis]
MDTFKHGSFSSQASGIFVDPTGQPLRVFVEAGEVLNRPKINNGAHICHSPDEATIILVDPETPSGGLFVKEWGSEPGKIVLDVSWVNKSVEARQALLADRNWGGFNTTENTSTLTQNPLPTPRETPPDAPNMQNQQPYPPPDNSQVPSGSVPPGFPYQQQLGQQMTNNLPSGTPIPMATMQSNPNAQVTLPAQLVAQLVGLVSQQGVNLNIPQMIPQIPGQLPMNIIQGQMIPQGYPQPIPFPSQPSMFVQPFPLSQQPAYPQQPVVNPPLPRMEASTSNLYQPVTPSSLDGAQSISQTQRYRSMSDTARPSPMEDIRSPSLKRKSPSLDPNSSSGRKSRANGERSAKHRRVSYPSDEPALPFPDSTPPSTQPRDTFSSKGKLFGKDNGEPYTFFVQIDLRPRTKIADAIKKHGGRLIPEIDDADFVILGSPASKTFEERLRQTQNCGKVAVRPQWVFECIEQNAIVDPDEFVFEGFHVEKKRGRPFATGKRWVVTGPNITSKPPKKEASFLPNEEVQMDDDDDDDEDTETRGKGKGKGKAKAKSSAKETIKKTEKKAAKAQGGSTSAAVSKGAAKSKDTTAQSTERTQSPKAFWQPSPTPPTRVVEHMPGKNMYTKEDMDYVDKYLQILFLRDPEMTLSAVSERMYAKMPHHTQKSWATYISHPTRREKVDKLRRQAAIARRKASANGQRLSEPAPQTQADAQGVEQTSSPSPATQFDPFLVLAKFFASGGADNLADADVWKVLNEKHPEMSAQEWEAFWLENNKDISVAVEQLSGVRADGDAEMETEAPMQYGGSQRVPKREPE